MSSPVTFRSEYFFSKDDAFADCLAADSVSTVGTAESLDAESVTWDDDAAAPAEDVTMSRTDTLGVLGSPKAKPKMLGPFKLGPVLGRGCTGTVRLGTHITSGLKVAFKIIKKEHFNTNKTLWTKVKREIAILKLIEHPNVLKLYDVYETPHALYLVLEHVTGGELFDHIIKKGRLGRDEALKFVAQITMGLEHCHHHSICHRDLKPENLLLDASCNIKIADFGMAQLMKNDNILRTSCGSPHYASPEIINGGQYDGKCTDVWSIGVILYALVTGSLPFDNDNIALLLASVTKGEFGIPAYVERDVGDLISQMLTVDATNRIPLAAIRKHPCFLHTRHFHAADAFSKPPPSGDPWTALGDTLDDSIVEDLASLGWGTTATIHERLSNKTPDFELGAVFYSLMSQRKKRRLYELHTISPRFQPVAHAHIASLPELQLLPEMALDAGSSSPPPLQVDIPKERSMAAHAHLAASPTASTSPIDTLAASTFTATSGRPASSSLSVNTSPGKRIKVGSPVFTPVPLKIMTPPRKPHPVPTFVTTPRFHRMRVCHTAPPSPLHSPSTEKAVETSWFSAIFARRPSLALNIPAPKAEAQTNSIPQFCLDPDAKEDV